MELIAKVTGINISDDITNLTVVEKDKNNYNLKINNLDNIYKGSERNTNIIDDFKEITELGLEEADRDLRLFYNQSPINLKDAEEEIKKYINKIDNKVIKEITKSLIDKYYDKYFIYPAASKLHHAYVGGLAHHCIGMLKFADGFIINYPYLNKDLVYAGILLHDIGKVIELSGVVDTTYSLKGQLIGHLVIGAMEIEEMAKRLGYEKTEEALLLEHMLLSHHGLPQFGAAKKPMTPEALVLWYIDTIDSKFRVLGEELEKTKPGEFSEGIAVLDKIKVYKSKNEK